MTEFNLDKLLDEMAAAQLEDELLAAEEEEGVNKPIGTKKSGYATPEMGPFLCVNCHHSPSGVGDRCDHPDVMEDPEVPKDDEGKGIVQPAGCCTYFRRRGMTA